MMSALRIRESAGRRGQVFTWDLIFSAVVFLIVFFIVIYLWDSITADIIGDLRSYEMKWLANSVAEQLVRTPGFPVDWKTSTVEVYGLADLTRVGRQVTPEDRVIDPDKLLFFILNVNDNYTEVRRSLIGSSRFDFYVVIACLNSSRLDCFHGLRLDSVNIPVSCANGFNLTIRNYTTDTNIWLEVEDPGLWGFNSTEHCDRGCSGGFMSLVYEDGSSVKTVKTNPGFYTVWVRGLSTSKEMQIVVDGVHYNIFDRVRGVVEWSRIGDFELDDSVDLWFNNTSPGNMIDSILLTTNNQYDPRVSNEEAYGNPNNILECIIGNRSLGDEAVEIVAGVKTGSFSEPWDDLTLLSGKQRLLEKTFKLHFVVWGTGEYGPIPSTTTTTTIPPERYSTSCVGKPDLKCIDGSNPIIVIDGVDVSGPLRCGSPLDVTVSWHGHHRGDFNHWGFFLDDGMHFIDACNSTNGTPEEPDRAYNYDMLCTLNVPSDLDAADGYHELIVTGEDYLGYCPPESGDLVDAVFSTSLVVANCIQYVPISCGGSPKKAVVCTPSGTIDRIYWIELDYEPVTCGDVVNVSVYWAGTHGPDEATFWAFLLDNGTDYLLLDKCSTRQLDVNKTFYNSTCAVDFTHPALSDLTGTEYRLVVTGESDLGYCSKVGEAEAVDDRLIEWTPCT